MKRLLVNGKHMEHEKLKQIALWKTHACKIRRVHLKTADFQFLSVRKLAAQMNASRESIWRIIRKKHLKLFPHKRQIAQMLTHMMTTKFENCSFVNELISNINQQCLVMSPIFSFVVLYRSKHVVIRIILKDQ